MSFTWRQFTSCVPGNSVVVVKWYQYFREKNDVRFTYAYIIIAYIRESDLFLVSSISPVNFTLHSILTIQYCLKVLDLYKSLITAIVEGTPEVLTGQITGLHIKRAYTNTALPLLNAYTNSFVVCSCIYAFYTKHCFHAHEHTSVPSRLKFLS